MNLSSVRRWRAARCLADPDPAPWREALGELGQDDERWWIGGPAMGRPEGARVVLREPLSLERVVSLQLDRNRASRTVDVPLPDELTCIRAFRQRLIPDTARAPITDVAMCLGWSQDGRRLLLLRSDGVGESVHVPTPGMQAKQPAGRTRRCQPLEDGVLVALGHRGRNIQALAWRDGALHTWGSGRWTHLIDAPDVVPPETPGLLRGGNSWRFQDGNQDVWGLVDGSLTKKRAGPGRLLHTEPLWFLDTERHTLSTLTGESAREDVRHCVTGNRAPLAYAVDRTWRTTASAAPVCEGPLGQVLGVVTLARRSTPQLVAHHAGQLYLCGLSGNHHVAQAHGALQGLWVNPCRAVIAWRMAQGDLFILDLDAKQYLLHPDHTPQETP
jgi:hypothetical protein